MPDDLLPADSTPAPEATPEAAETEVANEAAYDDASDLLEAETDEATQDQGDPEPEPEEAAVDETQAETEQEPQAPVLTHADRQALARAKIPEGSWKHLSRDAVDQIVTMQRQMDRLQAEAGRQQPAPTKADPAKQAPPADDDLDIQGVFAKLEESYDADIKPLGELLTKIDQRARPAMEAAQRLPAVQGLLQDLVLRVALDQTIKDYPSASKPEARAKLTERFWKEYGTGEYAPTQGGSMVDAIFQAMSEAAKAEFAGMTETAAAASLVTQNKQRLKAQPKTGSAKPNRPKPETDDDIYERAAKELLGS